MTLKDTDRRKPPDDKVNREKLDRIVAQAREARDEREKGYREQSLKIHPWICARCGREFIRENVHMLTVHHKDHNHNNNPSDGNNWENLCIYCHDNEHSRHLDHIAGGDVQVEDERNEALSHNPFAGLEDMLKEKKS